MVVGKSSGDGELSRVDPKGICLALKSNGIRFVALIRSEWELFIKSPITTMSHCG